MSSPAAHEARARAATSVVTVDGRAYPMASSVVATEAQIQRALRAMAQRITRDYRHLRHRDSRRGSKGNNDGSAGGTVANVVRTTGGSEHDDDDGEAPISYDNPLIILSVLKGSYIFTADLVRYLGDCGLPHVVDFVRVASYGGQTTSTGNVHVLAWPKFTDLQGKHVLLLEDVCDSGRTLHFLHALVQRHFRPKSLRTCVFMNKQASARRVAFTPEYACLDGPDAYVIGYGFEVNDRYRDLRHVFVLKDGEAGRFPHKL